MSNKKKNIHFSFIFSFIISFEYSSDGCIIFEENNKFVIKNIFNLQCNFDRIVAHNQKKKMDDMELFRCTAHSFFLLFLYYHETSGTVRAQNGRIRARSNPVRRNLNERIIR